MKKLLLAITGLSLSSALIAQTPTAEHTTGHKGALYVADFSSCVEEGGKSGGVTGKTDVVSYDDANKELVITTQGGQGAYARGATFIPMVDKSQIPTPYSCPNEVYTPIDITTLNASQKIVKVIAKASASTPVRITVGTNGNPSTFPCSNNNYGGAEVDFTFTAEYDTFTVDLSNSAVLASTCATGNAIDLSKITHIGFNPDIATGNFAGTIHIKQIIVGNAQFVTGVTLSVDNSLINLFPNPTNDVVRIDLSKLNGKAATLKVLNSFGAVVKEEAVSGAEHAVSLGSFEKGLYVIQISSNEKVSYKKVVVE